MKSAFTRVTVRPGKSVTVSREALDRARGALKAFAVAPADMERLAAFKGDVTIGPKRGAARPSVMKIIRVKRAVKIGEGAAPVASRPLKAA